MAETTHLPSQHSIPTPIQESNHTACVKLLAESPNLNSIPSNYAYYETTDETTTSEQEVAIPIIDFSQLTSPEPDKKLKAVQNLRKACEDWGFFMVINHGIPETLMKTMIDARNEFFILPEEEKPKFEPKNVLSPIRYGTSFNAARDKVFCWRDYVKVIVHPEFHCPEKPQSLRDHLLEYSDRTRTVARELMRGISKSLGLEEHEMEKALNLDSSLQIFVANYYPRCPQPDLTMGITPHSDHGLLTLLIQNEVGGLQIQHKGKWVNVNALPNSILVNTADHVEIFSNGKYKSVLHRAVVNNQKTRISIAMANGPSLDAIVCPGPRLVEKEGCTPAYLPMKYEEYLLLQQGNKLNAKSALDRVKIQD